MRIELADCERTLLREIADSRLLRIDVAQTYALAIRSGEAVDWGRVNRAIIERWSPHALDWIKGKAWSGKAFARLPEEQSDAEE